MTDYENDYVDAKGAAALAGVNYYTFTSYARRGQAPAPDLAIHGKKLWRRDRILAWVETRPGKGYRSDIHGKTFG